MPGIRIDIQEYSGPRYHINVSDIKDGGIVTMAGLGETVEWHIPNDWNMQIVFLNKSPFVDNDSRLLTTAYASSESQYNRYKKTDAITLKNSEATKGDHEYAVILWRRNHLIVFPYEHTHPHGERDAQSPTVLFAAPDLPSPKSPPRLVIG
jgi:hypothetical protein